MAAGSSSPNRPAYSYALVPNQVGLDDLDEPARPSKPGQFTEHLEDGFLTTDDGVTNSVSPEEEEAAERALVRKIDRKIMPCLFAMIVLNYLDRNALANARVQGIEKSLNMKGAQFNTAISILFVGYIALQIPSNLLLTRVRPSIYLPGCMILWGILSGMSAGVQSFGGLVTVRFFLGMVEAPYFPGALFLLSSWYTRKELALRTSILYSGSLLSGGFGGLIGAGVQSGLDGVFGIESWRWLFLLEACCTITLAIAAMFILPDYPHTTRSFTPAERALAVKRMQTGSHNVERGSLLSGLYAAITDYKVHLLAFIILTKTSAAAVTSFIPTLVSTFGYPQVTTLLLVAPPYVFATLITLAVSYSSDHFSSRATHIILPMAFAASGYILAACTLHLAARYLSLFIMLSGVYGSYNVALAWISSTLPHPVEKRSAAIAVINTVGNLAQVYSPYMYLERDAPRYLPAMVADATVCCACVGAAGLLWWCLRRENLRLEAAERDDGDDGDEDGGNVGKGATGGFRYQL
ncbi:MFS transporter [Aulographum hederae CBS 113979]|uniref:MFS transporter n=1 Tax=Aulographum hederae CBS 113979 TaxID=1176131 RepID=A0A6G1H3F1_9PEZI|nr:MFS transporter [Aulographum hederae CBS 113979]